MAEHAAYVSEFYEGQPIELPYRVYLSGAAVEREISIQRSTRQQTISEAEVWEKVNNIDLQMVEHEGSRFEVARLNHDTATSEDAVLHLSTYSSSITGNPGNAFEFAYQAALNPGVPQVYVASFGNGGTSALTARERSYAWRTGRLTWENDGKTIAIPTVQHLVGALALKGQRITRLGTDSSGSVVGVAVGAALPEGQVTHTAFNSHPQLTQVHELSLAWRMLVREGLLNAPEAQANTPDKWPVNKWRMDFVKDARPDIYTADWPGSTTPERLGMLATNLVALSHGINGQNPIAHDLAAFIEQQSAASINFVVATRDPIYSRQLNRNISWLMKHFGPKQAESLRVVLVPGMTHSMNTHYPQLHQAIKSTLLGLPDQTFPQAA